MLEVFKESPHRRWNPLRREWVIVSPHRTQRPWQGQTEETATVPAKSYDPECYLCPGNVRAGGHRTPVYTETYVFENDFAALKSDVVPAEFDAENAGLLRATTERGVCRVLCFDPRHDLLEFVGRAERNIFLADHLSAVLGDVLLGMVVRFVRPHVVVADHVEVLHAALFHEPGN